MIMNSIIPDNLSKITNPQIMKEVIADHQKIISQVAQLVLQYDPAYAQQLDTYNHQLAAAQSIEIANPVIDKINALFAQIYNHSTFFGLLPPEINMKILGHLDVPKFSKMAYIRLGNQQLNELYMAYLISEQLPQYRNFFIFTKEQLESKSIMCNELSKVINDLKQFSQTGLKDLALKDYAMTKWQKLVKSYPRSSLFKHYASEWINAPTNDFTKILKNLIEVNYFINDSINLLKEASPLIDDIDLKLRSMEAKENTLSFFEFHQELYSSLYFLNFLNMTLISEVYHDYKFPFPLGLEDFVRIEDIKIHDKTQKAHSYHNLFMQTLKQKGSLLLKKDKLRCLLKLAPLYLEISHHSIYNHRYCTISSKSYYLRFIEILGNDLLTSDSSVKQLFAEVLSEENPLFFTFTFDLNYKNALANTLIELKDFNKLKKFISYNPKDSHAIFYQIFEQLILQDKLPQAKIILEKFEQLPLCQYSEGLLFKDLLSGVPVDIYQRLDANSNSHPFYDLILLIYIKTHSPEQNLKVLQYYSPFFIDKLLDCVMMQGSCDLDWLYELSLLVREQEHVESFIRSLEKKFKVNDKEFLH